MTGVGRKRPYSRKLESRIAVRLDFGAASGWLGEIQ
jgi:hypothetical protein